MCSTLRRRTRVGGSPWAALFGAMLYCSCGPSVNPPTGLVDASDALEDSLAAVDEELSRVSPETTESLVHAILTVDPQPDLPALPRVANKQSSTTMRWSVVGGEQADVRGIGVVRSTAQFGVRTDTQEAIGYVSVTGRGWLRQVVAGNLTLRMGHRLGLGQRLGSFPPLIWSPVRSGFAVSPSLSRWFGKQGIAVDLGKGRWRGVGVVASTAAAEYRARAMWLSIIRINDRGSIGLTVGRELTTDSPLRRAASAAALHSIAVAGSFEFSGEALRFQNGSMFAALRLRPRDLSRRLGWSLGFFRAPSPTSSPVTALHSVRPDRIYQGASIDASGAVYRNRARVSASVGTAGTTTDHRRFRRVVGSVKTPRYRGWALEFMSSFVELSKFDYASDVLITRIGQNHAAEGIVRGVADARPSPGVRFRFRVDHLLPQDGVLVSVTSAVTTGPFEVRWSATAHRIEPGRRAYFARPAAGPFDAFASATGRGSDVSFRLRWFATERWIMMAYYRSTWQREPRFYVGSEVRVR